MLENFESRPSKTPRAANRLLRLRCVHVRPEQTRPEQGDRSEDFQRINRGSFCREAERGKRWQRVSISSCPFGLGWLTY